MARLIALEPGDTIQKIHDHGWVATVTEEVVMDWLLCGGTSTYWLATDRHGHVHGIHPDEMGVLYRVVNGAHRATHGGDA